MSTRVWYGERWVQESFPYTVTIRDGKLDAGSFSSSGGLLPELPDIDPDWDEDEDDTTFPD
jgi:hypothetical protein